MWNYILISSVLDTGVILQRHVCVRVCACFVAEISVNRGLDKSQSDRGIGGCNLENVLFKAN